MLRSSPEWRTYVQPPPPLLTPREELESRIESIIGHINSERSNKLKWGHVSGRAVEVTRSDNTTVHVDLDLDISVPDPIPDPEVDVDFDLHFACDSGVISIQMRNPLSQWGDGEPGRAMIKCPGRWVAARPGSYQSTYRSTSNSRRSPSK